MRCAYRFDKEFKESYVITGACALARCGLIYLNGSHLDLQTSIKQMDNFHTAIFTYHYNENIDMDYELSPSASNKLLLLPSKERALIECIQHLDWVDEGLLIEALQTYIDQFFNREKLYEVADHFSLQRTTVDYWLSEAENDFEV